MFSFAFSRLFNAGAVLTASVLSALIVSADNWAQVSIMHTAFSYLVFLNLGVNEGIGQRIVKNKKLYSPVFVKLVSFLFLSSLASLLAFFLFKSHLTFLYLSGTLSLLLFSLMRLYYRGTGNLKGLTYLYWFNSVIILLSPFFIYLYNEPKIFIYFFILGACTSSFITIRLSGQKFNLFNIFHIKKPFESVFRKIKVLIGVGFPIMISGVVFEVIISVDRFYMNTFYEKNIVGNIGLSLMIVKGGIMLLSILNTASFKNLSTEVSLNNNRVVRKLYSSQVIKGLISSLTFVTVAFLIISSNWFSEEFPSYIRLSEIFIYQALILLPLSSIFPLSVISNFKFGGIVYLFCLIGALSLYLGIVFSLHEFLNMLLTIKALSLIVFLSLVISVVLLNIYIYSAVKKNDQI